MKRGWAAPFRSTPLPASSAARSRLPSWRRWSQAIGGHGALIVTGAVGPLVALLLVMVGIPDASAADRGTDGARAPQQNIITPALIVLTIFFMLLSLSSAGIGNFGVVALMSGYGASFSTANIALTAFLGASAVGVLAGGFLADHTQRHGQVAAACFAAQCRDRAADRGCRAAAAAADRGDGGAPDFSAA